VIKTMVIPALGSQLLAEILDVHFLPQNKVAVIVLQGFDVRRMTSS
jgi:hypothetical protein